MSKKRLGVGIIGTGFIGKFHIRSWIAVRDGDINGIYDKNVENANEAAALVKQINVGDPKVFNSITD